MNWGRCKSLILIIWQGGIYTSTTNNARGAPKARRVSTGVKGKTVVWKPSRRSPRYCEPEKETYWVVPREQLSAMLFQSLVKGRRTLRVQPGDWEG